MEFAFALLLCGLSCALASPTCSESEFTECGTNLKANYYRNFPETVEDMDQFCSSAVADVGCQLDFVERCPNTFPALFLPVLDKYKEAFGKLCDKEKPLRQKFVEKAPCLNKEVHSVEEKCTKRATETDYCKRTTAIFKCCEEEINEVCGSDGKDVFAQIYEAKLESETFFCRFGEGNEF